MKEAVSLFEQLKPPVGYETTFAIGTTYSVDLLTATAALIALDGRARDQLPSDAASAVRALRRLRGRVHVVAQQGCVHGSARLHRGIQGLLDSFIVTVPFDLAKSTFHPKVWCVQQRPARNREGSDRWLLVVGSRNLTLHESWDLGVAMDGSPSTKGNVPGVQGFLEHVCDLAGIARPRALTQVDTIEWSPPPSVDGVRFAWHAGDGVARSTVDGHPWLGVPIGTRMLALSPFVDRYPARELARVSSHLGRDDKLLLAGEPDLIRTARESSALLELNPHVVDVVRDDEPADGGDAEGDSEDLRPNRGLHAKVLATWDTYRRARLVVGSANLTTRAWNGHNCEAWLLLETRHDVVDPLWDWARARALPFVPDHERDDEAANQELEQLEAMHRGLSASVFTLREPAGQEGVLSVHPGEPVPASFRVSVRRVTQVGTRVTLVDGKAILPVAAPGERTCFVEVVVDGPTRSLGWLQRASVDPALDETRDAAALSSIFTADDFVEFLWAQLSPDRMGGDAPPSPSAPGRPSVTRGRPIATGALRLEHLLRAFERDLRADHGSTLVKDLDRLITEYRANLPAAQAERHRDLFSTWQLVREALA